MARKSNTPNPSNEIEPKRTRTAKPKNDYKLYGYTTTHGEIEYVVTHNREVIGVYIFSKDDNRLINATEFPGMMQSAKKGVGSKKTQFTEVAKLSFPVGDNSAPQYATVEALLVFARNAATHNLTKDEVLFAQQTSATETVTE